MTACSRDWASAGSSTSKRACAANASGTSSALPGQRLQIVCRPAPAALAVISIVTPS